MSISLNIREWCGIHCGDFVDKDDCGELRAIADRIDREIVEYERMKKEADELKAELDELKAELDDWKGNAEGFQPDEYMKLPLDADGEPIRIGDVLYSSGNECRVVSITVKADEACVGVHTDEGVFLPSVNPKYLSRKNPELLEDEQADSWEKLKEDVNLGSRDYCERYRLDECDYNKRMHMLARAKKLAGIEDGGAE